MFEKINKLFKKINWFHVLYWLSLLMLTFLLHFDHRLNGDEGVVLNGAWNLINQRHLYNDFFEFITPGSFYLIFIIWKIFGVSFWAAKILAIFFVFLGAIGLYKAGQLIIKNGLINLSIPLIFIAMSGWWWIINHNIFNLAFLIWSTYFFIRGLNDLKIKNFVTSGLLAGLAILFLQQKGLVILGASSLFLVFLAIKNKQIFLYTKLIILFITSSLLPLLLLCFWPLNTILYNLIKYPFFGYISVNRILYTLLAISFILWLFCFLILKMTKEKSKNIQFLIFIQFCLLLSTYPLPDIYHISQIIFPLILIIFYLADRILIIYPNKLIKYYFFTILTFILVTFVTFDLVINSPELSIWNKNKNYQLLNLINSNCPGKYLYSGPFAPFFYFETKKLNATPYSVLITRQSTPEQFIIALDSFKKRQPTCAILYYPESFTRFKHDKNNPLEKYIREKYTLTYQPLNGLFIYKDLENR